MVVLGWDPADTHTTNFWTELASTTLTSDQSTISSGTFTAKKYLMFSMFSKQSSTGDPRLRFNSDSTTTYSQRRSTNGGADTTDISITGIVNLHPSIADKPSFIWGYIINVSSKEKLVIVHNVDYGGSGAGMVPNRVEEVAKWANTSSQITSLDWSLNTGNYRSGTILKVWGSD